MESKAKQSALDEFQNIVDIQSMVKSRIGTADILRQTHAKI